MKEELKRNRQDKIDEKAKDKLSAIHNTSNNRNLQPEPQPKDYEEIEY